MDRPLVNGWHDERGAKELMQFMRTRETADERQATFMLYAMDNRFSRHDLSRAMEMLGYGDGNFDNPPVAA